MTLSREVARLSATCLLTCAGCGASAVCAPRVELSDLDEPVGIVGRRPRIIAADAYERWIVYAQPRRDTNGDGNVSGGPSFHGDLVGDAQNLFLDRVDASGAHVEESIDAFLGRHLGRLYVLIGEEVVALAPRGEGREVVARIAPIPREQESWTLGESWDVDVAEDGTIAFRAGPRIVEVIDGETGARERIETEGRVSSVQLGPTGSLLVLDTLDDDPADPRDTHQLPHRIVSGATRACRGLTCDGAASVTRVYRVDVARPTLIFEERGARSYPLPRITMWLRPWGLVVESPPRDMRALELYGHHVESPCVPVHVGLDSAFIVARCAETEPPVVIPLDGSRPVPLDSAESTQFLSRLDSQLLRRAEMRERLAAGARPLWIHDDGAKWVVPSLGIESLRAEGVWRPIDRGCPADVLAVREDRWHLTFRSARGCDAREERGQLVWTGPLDPDLCVATQPTTEPLSERMFEQAPPPPSPHVDRAPAPPSPQVDAAPPSSATQPASGGSVSIPDPWQTRSDD